MLARIGAVVFVAIVITATAIDMAREDEPSAPPAAPTIQPSTDPLRAEERRCQRLGEQAASDAECMAVWAATRDRFLGRPHARSGAQNGEAR